MSLSFAIVAPAYFETFARWQEQPWGKRGEDYDALKNHFTERLLEHLFAHFPQLRGKIDYCELSTPLSTDFFCAYKRGEMYGLTHDTGRFEQQWLRPKTSIKGLYLTGQDIMTCGVGGAMAGGFMCALSVPSRNAVSMPSSPPSFRRARSSFREAAARAPAFRIFNLDTLSRDDPLPDLRFG